ncbi:hypothetical protein SM0020_05290 [Sinorhizobium meliloti CCNWSX0020]|uniref:Uncharacterized protein n=1 Tax=Sinorhizobium meliloti CCNWSX0020 TaxID=1107881 RepID=H0FV60_RHIML|nr:MULTISPECIES: hypothetical protein [Sinorhizobium]PII39068.1 hypothetical protein T190_11355 [Sinorhizobium meliloti CCBAU 01290]EHK79105.1 hypothetical protein SM0020_05290 [Sinorhizobium meliloti CCNWSX0020]RVE92026.1 hypothetical protein CN238_04735 [Sinorhizobium meliloti]RVG63343.1 hypothetical protein CN220_27750 [Sinorhizobium meliloti]RVH35243.1 hypothetical protein CN214_04070 [Sinorhizobium meliloti]
MTYLEEDSERGIQLFMAEHAVNREEALRLIVRDWLGSHGYLALTEDESGFGKDTEMDATATLGGA